MAENKENTSTKTKTKDVIKDTIIEDSAIIEKDINADAKVTVRNLAGWDVTFRRLNEGIGDVIIAPNGQVRLLRSEIHAQVDNNNKLFTGVDGKGSHATIVIEDKITREWVGFEEDGNPQKVFTKQLVKDLFDMKQEKYEVAVRENIITRAEKYAFIKTIKELGLNDYSKMMFAVEYTGYKL